MSPEHESRPLDDVGADQAKRQLDDMGPDTEQPDAAWLREHRELVINDFVLRSGGGPSADRKTRRRAQVTARHVYRRMVRDAVQRDRKGGGG